MQIWEFNKIVSDQETLSATNFAILDLNKTIKTLDEICDEEGFILGRSREGCKSDESYYFVFRSITDAYKRIYIDKDDFVKCILVCNYQTYSFAGKGLLIYKNDPMYNYLTTNLKNYFTTRLNDLESRKVKILDKYKEDPFKE